jgi:hypothetical protein
MASTKTEKTENDLVVFLFVEFSPGNIRYLLDGYVKTLEEVKHDCMEKLWKTMFNQVKTTDLKTIKICKIPYHPDYFNLFVIMDLDKTAYLSGDDVINPDDKKFFIDHYEVSGMTAISNEYFRYKMMIRPGMHWAIRRLQRISELHLLTAGDIHFARRAVIQANEKKWSSKEDITTKDEPNLEDVFIPLTNLNSTRDRIKFAAPKTFERSLPFSVFMEEYGLTSENLPVLCIDDTITAWDKSIQPNVIPISVFQPLNNSHVDILNIVEKIEKCSELYFNQLLSELFKDCDPSITELNIDFETFITALKKVNIVDILKGLQ